MAQVAEQLVGQIQSGGLNVSVNGRTVAVANATLRSSTQQILIVEPSRFTIRSASPCTQKPSFPCT